MNIWNLGNNKFAIGTKGKAAAYVVTNRKGKVVGVRGQRPVLDGRYKTTKATKEITAALRTAVK